MKEDVKVEYDSIKIHKKALADIVLSVIQGIDGVKMAEQGLWDQVLQKMSHRTHPGIKVLINRDNEVSLEVGIFVRYGLNIPEISRQCQEAIRDTIEKTTDIILKKVHVNIDGIEGGI